MDILYSGRHAIEIDVSLVEGYQFELVLVWVELDLSAILEMDSCFIGSCSCEMIRSDGCINNGSVPDNVSTTNVNDIDYRYLSPIYGDVYKKQFDIISQNNTQPSESKTEAVVTNRSPLISSSSSSSSPLPLSSPSSSFRCFVPGCGKAYKKLAHLKAHLRWHDLDKLPMMKTKKIKK